MGTRSLTVVFDESGNRLLSIYRQFDGYPAGAGADLAAILNHRGKPRPIGNGFSLDPAEVHFNGAEDAAAEILARLKIDHGGWRCAALNGRRARRSRYPVGGVYVTASADASGVAYVYTLRPAEDPAAGFAVSVSDGDEIIFRGDSGALLQWTRRQRKNENARHRRRRARK